METVIERPHPFTRVRRREFRDEDDIGTCLRWRPGAWAQVYIYPDDCQPAAHAMGTCRFEIHGEYKPNGYPTRVFYTQTFIDPDGHEMKRGKLRIKVKHWFEKQVEDIGFLYELDPKLDVLDET